MTKEITHKFIDFFDMSVEELCSKEPKLKHIVIKAPEDAKFAFRFYEFFGDHRGGISTFYCGNCDTDITGQEDKSHCEMCGYYFVRSLGKALKEYFDRVTKNQKV